MKTTFEKIKAKGPCIEGWGKLMKYHKPSSMSQEISIKEIIDSNGIRDAVWALMVIDDQSKALLFCSEVIESVLSNVKKQTPYYRTVKCGLKYIRKFAFGKVTKNELILKRNEIAGDAILTSGSISWMCYALVHVAEGRYYAAMLHIVHISNSTAGIYIYWNDIRDVLLKYC